MYRISISVVPILTAREALSGVAGSISLVSWIVLLLPQLVENYKNGSADALSPAFLIAWLLGDLANLIGAIWGSLLPTVIALAAYFCFADVMLLSQIIFYNHITGQEKIAGDERRLSNCSEEEPLLSSERRNSSTVSRCGSITKFDVRLMLLTPEVSPWAKFTGNAFSIIVVCVVGTMGWFIAWKTGAWGAQDDSLTDENIPVGAEILGYISAVLYLTARIPQIIQNYRKKSCDGLSLLFFCLSLLGNLTYGAGILFHSTDLPYVINNTPWLLGSLGTMIEDIIIFTQFHMYSKSAEPPSII
ncbi:vacuolar membrane PQ loop repeat protein [Geopyxis carbonaria]|nr:vacuolar membrane PQ loop repeat protein [Geopyxis carbonaria]